MNINFQIYSIHQDAEDLATLMRGQGYQVSIVETTATPVVRFPDANHSGNMSFADIADANTYWVVYASK